MRKESLKKLLGIGVILPLLYQPMSLSAEEDEFSLDELLLLNIVTAQKRAQSAQDISIAMTVVSGSDIKGRNLAQPIDIAAQTPGLTAKNVLNKALPIFTIRGIGNTAFTSNSVAPVGVYVDELFMPSGSMLNFQLFDVERVEVMKGPQGTLFGRNTTGGALSVVTKRPTHTKESALALTSGSYRTNSVEGFINGPLKEGLAGRLAMRWNGQGEGFFENDLTGNDVGKTNNFGLRGSLLSEVSDRNIFWSAHFAQESSENEPWVGIGRRDPSTVTGTTTELPGGDLTKDQCASFADQSIGYFIDNCSNNLGYRDPFADPFKGEFSQEPILDAYSFGTVLSVDWTLGMGTLTSVTGYERKDSIIEEDFDGGPFVIGDTSYGNDVYVFSQELRMSSDADDSDFSWMVGGLLYRDVMNVSDLYGYRDRVNHDVLVKFKQETTSYAVFAHTETQLTDLFKLIAGVRYTTDDIGFDGGTTIVNRDTDYTGDASFFSETPILVDDSADASEVTGKLGIEATPIDNMLLYFTASKGYKAGVWNGFWAATEGDHSSTDPEYITATELGLKFTLPSKGMQLNIAAYFYDYKDMQLFADLPDGRFTIFNAGEAEISGQEIEFLYRPNKNFRAGINLALNDAEVSGGTGLTTFSDATPPNTPETSINGLVEYSWGVAGSRKMLVGFDFSYQDDVYFSLDNLKAVSESAYSILNMRVGLGEQDDSWLLTGWINNLSDEEVFTEILSSGSAGAVSGQVGRPRTLGVSYTRNFH